MMKQKYQTGKQIKSWFEQHPVWVLLSITLFILTLVVTANASYSIVEKVIVDKYLWKNTEQSKIDMLAPTETISYFNSILGEPNVKNIIHNKVTNTEVIKYVYKERGYYVEAIVDSDGIVQIMDITACGHQDDFYPIIKNNPVGNEIILGKTKMDSAAISEDNYHQGLYYSDGDISDFYDRYDGDESTNYQTVVTGFSGTCDHLVLPVDIRLAIEKSVDGHPTKEQVDRIRRGTSINIFAIASPSSGFSRLERNIYDLSDGGGIGVPTTISAALSSSKKTDDYKNRLNNAKEFEVVAY